MAHVRLNNTTARREWFLIDKPVGSGCPNANDDVLLVQFLLRICSQNASDMAGFQPPGEKPLDIDGVCGPQTLKYISFYQREVNRRQGKKLLEPDGRIDPIRHGTRGSISHTLYTILSLNVSYRTRRGDAAKIETDPFFPIKLQSSLFVG